MNISFALTTEQVRRRIKTETRRLKWEKLVAASARGEQPILQGIVKGQGLKKGEHPEFITDIRVVRAWREPLNRITPEAVVREGFPGRSPEWFVDMFCKHNDCEPKTKISVLSFEYPWHVEYLKFKQVIHRSDYPELMEYIRQREIKQAIRWWAASRDSLQFQLESGPWQAAAITPLPKTRCPLDTDGDGNCPIHPKGCP